MNSLTKFWAIPWKLHPEHPVHHDVEAWRLALHQWQTGGFIPYAWIAIPESTIPGWDVFQLNIPLQCHGLVITEDGLYMEMTPDVEAWLDKQRVLLKDGRVLVDMLSEHVTGPDPEVRWRLFPPVELKEHPGKKFMYLHHSALCLEDQVVTWCVSVYVWKNARRLGGDPYWTCGLTLTQGVTEPLPDDSTYEGVLRLYAETFEPRFFERVPW